MTADATAAERPALSATGTRFAVATPHAVATEVAAQLLSSGANALDAAVAGAAALTVTYPHMCAIGGDVMALVALPDGTVHAVNGSGAAPSKLPGELAGRESMPIDGPHTVTVPGAVAAWESIRSLGATLPFGALLKPAISLAEEGTPVAESLARSIVFDLARLSSDAGMRKMFLADGAPLRAGATLRQPALAGSLRALADEGPSALYGGVVGRQLIGGLGALGSTLTIEDLAAHRTEVTAPLRGRIGEEEVLTAPPNSQGLLLLEVLNALDALGPRDWMGRDADLLAEVFRLAARDRDVHLADPRAAAVPVDRLLSPRHAAELSRAALARRADPGGYEATLQPRPTGDTIALVAADDQGYAAVIIQSVFHGFGAGILEPSTGIVLHNRGASFSLTPGSPNLLAPGRRPAHTLMPVMVRRAERVIGLHGTMGGRGQPQFHTQLILRLREGLDADDAVAAPRFVVGGLGAGDRDDDVHAEAGVAAEAVAAFRAAGFPVRGLPDNSEDVGHSQMISLKDDGLLHAASDPRADGSAAAA